MTACGSDEPAIVITGRLVTLEGEPATATVGIVQELAPNPIVGELAERVHVTEPDAEGAFRIEIEETDDSYGRWRLRADAESGNGFTTVLPGMPERSGIYDFGELVVAGDFDVAISPDATPTVTWASGPGTQTLTILDADHYDGRPVWRIETDGSSATLDPRTYQDFGAAIRVGSFLEPEAGDAERIEWASAPVAAQLDGTRPVSRDAACELETGAGTVSGTASGAPCFATDGRLSSGAADDCELCTVRSITVDLEQTRDVNAISFHAIELNVETEHIIIDGARFDTPFEELGRVDTASLGENALVEFDGKDSVRYVRIRFSPEPNAPGGWIDEIGVF